MGGAGEKKGVRRGLARKPFLLPQRVVSYSMVLNIIFPLQAANFIDNMDRLKDPKLFVLFC